MGDLVAAHAGQQAVEDHQLRLLRLEQPQRFFAGGDGVHLTPVGTSTLSTSR